MSSISIDKPDGGVAPMTAEERKVILASSAGTIFEWYDFYLYGSLAAIIGKQFFAGLGETTSFILALAVFAAGFAVRPFGALVFGRLGDLVGRKYTFLVTILLMGASTFIVGILPGSASIGIAAPILLVALRLIQGLALGGEYGGAATYVAEHAPHSRRGFYTAWIQTTATLGLFLSLVVIYLTRQYVNANFAPIVVNDTTTITAFDQWGWRIPFVLSVVLLGISLWIRLKLSESPAFLKMKAEGTHSKTPLREAFGQWKNAKIALIALLGAVAGQAVVWYTGQFYALLFMKQVLKVEAGMADLLVAASLLIGTGGFLFFGWLSDKIGRKPVIMAGLVLAAATYFPLFSALTQYANPAYANALKTAPVTVLVDPAECSFQFAPGELKEHIKFRSSCDIAKSVLAGKYVSYRIENAAPGTVASVKIGEQSFPAFNATGMSPEDFKTQSTAFQKSVNDAVTAAGYPAKADPAQMNVPMIILILTILVLYVTMVYGPIAALLVELFPTRIRYSGMSLPYHIGNGWFGGFLPTFAFAMVAATGDIFYGLWYPIIIALGTFVIGILFLPETKDRDIFANEEN
jgi:MFS family permease